MTNSERVGIALVVLALCLLGYWLCNRTSHNKLSAPVVGQHNATINQTFSVSGAIPAMLEK